MYHFAVFGAWIVIRPWLQDHQCFSEVMDEGVGQLVGLPVFRVCGQFAKAEFNEANSRESNEFGWARRDALVERGRFKIADNKAVDRGKILIKVQAKINVLRHFSAIQPQRMTVGRGDIEFAQGANRQVFEHSIHGYVDRMLGRSVRARNATVNSRLDVEIVVPEIGIDFKEQALPFRFVAATRRVVLTELLWREV